MTVRVDVHVPNESDGFVFTSASQRGRGLMPGEAAWREAVAEGRLLPLLVESEDPANVRVVVGGELSEEEEAQWVGRVSGGLRIPDGRLALCGGAAYVLEADAWAAEYARVVEVPAGDYRVTLLCYPSAPNGRLCLEAAGAEEPLGTWFRRTRGGEAMPAWLHNRCVNDPDEDPAHRREWKKASERPGSPVIDFLLHLQPATQLEPAPVEDHGFAEAGECRIPGVFPLGLPAVAIGEEADEEDGEEAEEAPAPAAPGPAPRPIPGGPVEVPLPKLARVARLAWLCHPYTHPDLRVEFPGKPAPIEPPEGVTVRREGSVLRFTFDDDGQSHGAADRLVALAKLLAGLPDGCRVELDLARPRGGGSQLGLHRYSGPVAAGCWRLEQAFPGVEASTLREALSLTEAMEAARRLLARDAEEAERIEARVRERAPHVTQYPGLDRNGAELALRKRDPGAFLEVVSRAFWMRYRGVWPLQDGDLDG